MKRSFFLMVVAACWLAWASSARAETKGRELVAEATREGRPLPQAPAVWKGEKKAVGDGKILVTGLKAEGDTLEIIASDSIRLYKVCTLSNPARLVLDIADAASGFQADSIALNRMGATTIRFESHPGFLRIFLDGVKKTPLPYRLEESVLGLKVILSAP